MSKTRDEQLQRLILEAQKIKKQFDSCTSFKEKKGILKAKKRAVQFYEGKQWGDFKGSLPFEKPTANIIANIIDNKVASINQKTFKINFRVDNDQLSTNKVTNFAEYQTKEMEQSDINVNATYDGLNKGTFIEYFYWDDKAIGLLGNIEGALKCVLADLEDFAVANPTEKDVQKQDYVILRSRESVKTIRQMCTILNDEEKKQFIKANDKDSIYDNNVEQDNEEACYSYLKFFRKDGEVYYIKCTNEIVYQEATAINPLINAEIIRKSRQQMKKDEENNEEEISTMYEADTMNKQTMTEGDNFNLNEKIEVKYKAMQYPFVVDSFLRRNDCIFGRSLTYQLIPMQKLINQLIAINALSAVKSIMPTLVVKRGSLGMTDIDLSKPGGMITDNSVGTTGFGIQVLQTPPLSANHFELAQNMISLLKDIYRASDILDDGRNLAKNMSGYAMSQLQTIQDKPVAQMQEILSRSIAREGRILEMYYKLYYHEKQYSYQLTDTELINERQAQGEGVVDVTQIPRTRTDMFDGTDYLETPFNVTVEIEETARQSELMLTATLEMLFLNGTIEKISPEYLMAWAELVPNYAFSKKDEFKRLVKQRMESENTQLRQELQKKDQALLQSEAYNQSLKEEFTNKINQSNEMIRQMQSNYDNIRRQMQINNKTAPKGVEQ